MAFEKVTTIDEIEDDEAFIVEGEPKILLFKSGSEVFATQFYCTHEEASLEDAWVNENCSVTCPWHSAEFDLRTGEALSAPASEPLKTYPVKLEGEDVWVDRG